MVTCRGNRRYIVSQELFLITYILKLLLNFEIMGQIYDSLEPVFKN
jgi:hypothetical protein